jgi:hypothetical protein
MNSFMYINAHLRNLETNDWTFNQKSEPFNYLKMYMTWWFLWMTSKLIEFINLEFYNWAPTNILHIWLPSHEAKALQLSLRERNQTICTIKLPSIPSAGHTC